MPFYKSPKIAKAGLVKTTPAEIKQNLIGRLPDDCVTCGRQIYIGMFFDGTGNNKYTKPDEKTNVSHLHEAYLDKPSDKFYKHYIAGVGTPCPDAGDEKDGDGIGGAFGNMGQERIVLGLIHMLNTVKKAVLGAELIDKSAATALCKELGGGIQTLEELQGAQSPPPRDQVIPKLKEKANQLKSEIEGKMPKVTQINLSVFGFSRGAAEARTFCNWLEHLCEEHNLAGVKVQIDFLGIFDTVASVGLSDGLNLDSALYLMSGHNSWGNPEYLRLSTSGFIKKCVHYVAGTEARACFPSDLVRNGKAYPGFAHETVYPGAHSDVGGGYPEGTLGIEKGYIAQITGQHMYQEAFVAGVPLLKPEDLTDEVKVGLTINKKAADDFNRYVERMKSFTGDSAESQMYAYWKNYLMQRAVSEHTRDLSMIMEFNDHLVDITQQEIFSYVGLYIARVLASSGVSVSATVDDKGRYFNRLTTTSLSGNVDQGLSVLLDLYATWASVFGGREPKNAPEHNPLFMPSDTVNTESASFFRKRKSSFSRESVFSDMAYKYIHDSQAGFISMLSGADGEPGIKKAFMGYALEEGEFSLNAQGIMKHRRIYAGSLEQVNAKTIPKYTASNAHKRVTEALAIHRKHKIKLSSEDDVLSYLLDLITPPIAYPKPQAPVNVPPKAIPNPEPWNGSGMGGDYAGGGAGGSW